MTALTTGPADAVRVLQEAFGRIDQLVHQTVDGMTLERMTYRPDAEANSVSWLIWHLTRVQDDHIAGVAGVDQVWSGEWRTRCGLSFDLSDIGYGHDSDQVGAVQVPAGLLVEYHERVQDQSLAFLAGAESRDLDRIVDEEREPPVTLLVRLVSVVSDCLQHAGQAAYVRGLAERASANR